MAGIINKSKQLSRRTFLTVAAGTAVSASVGSFSGCTNFSARHRLVVYSAGPGRLAEKAKEMFEQQTGETIELFRATTGQIMAKLQAERYNRRADIVILASRLAAEYLKHESLFHAYTPEDVAFAYPNDSSMYHMSSAAAVGIAVRAQSFDPTLTWEDVLAGEYQGRIVMPSPSRSGTAADFVLNFVQLRGEQAWPMFLKAKRAGMEIGGANSQAIGGLLTGAYDAIFAAADYLILRQMQQHAPIRLLFPTTGVPLVERPIAIMRGTHLESHAQAFVRMYFSNAFQTHIAQGHLLSGIKGVPVSTLRQEAGELKPWPMDVAGAVKQQARILRRFQYEIERAVVSR